MLALATAMTDQDRTLDLKRFAPYRLAVLGRMMSQTLGAAYRDEGLSIPEWRVLAVVSQKPTMAARDVVAQTPMDKMAVSRAVAALEGKGLLVRRKAQDRRVAEIQLTDKGAEVFARIAAIARAYEERAFGDLSAADRDMLFALLDRLEAKVAAMGNAGAAR